MSSRARCFALMALVPLAALADPGDDDAITPYRPSVSGPAQLPAPGQRGTSSSFGDTTVVLKRAWRIDDASAAGMEFSVKLPTAREPIATRPASGLTQFFAGVVFPLARVW